MKQEVSRRLTHIGFVVRHREFAHEVDASLAMNGDCPARPRAVVQPVVKVSAEGGVLLEGQTSL